MKTKCMSQCTSAFTMALAKHECIAAEGNKPFISAESVRKVTYVSLTNIYHAPCT